MAELESMDLDIYWESSENMEHVSDNSVQSVITSPPYWDLKDYDHDNQIGIVDESYNEYHNRMQAVWEECYNVLKEDGTMWIVVDTVMERGDLKLLPYHITQRAEEVGFSLQDIVTWYKPTAIAGMSDRNIVNKKEYVLFLSKNKDYKFYPNDAGNDSKDPAFSKNNRLGNLWRFPVKRGTAGQNVLHKAPYPTSLVKRMINISTKQGDTILDPFFGSGTTAVAALNQDRRCIGYEINADFEKIISKRLDSVQQRSLDSF